MTQVTGPSVPPRGTSIAPKTAANRPVQAAEDVVAKPSSTPTPPVSPSAQDNDVIRKYERQTKKSLNIVYSAFKNGKISKEQIADLIRRGISKAFLDYLDKGGIEGGTANEEITKEEFEAGLRKILNEDTIRALTAQGKTEDDVISAIIEDFKTCKEVAWVATEEAAKEYVSKMGNGRSNYFDGDKLKLNTWLASGCNPELKEAAKIAAKRILGLKREITDTDTLNMRQFTALLYALALASHSNSQQKYGLGNNIKTADENILAWATKGSSSPVEAKKADTSADPEVSGDEKLRQAMSMTERDSQSIIGLKLKAGANQKELVRNLKDALAAYKNEIKSTDTEKSKKASQNLALVVQLLMNFDQDNAAEYLPDLIAVYRERVQKNPDDMEAKGALIKLLFSQSAEKEKLSQVKGISEAAKNGLKEEAEKLGQEALELSKSARKQLHDKISEIEQQLKTAVPGDVSKLTGRKEQLEKELKDISDSSSAYRLPGQLDFSKVITDEKAKLKDIKEAYDRQSEALKQAITSEEGKGAATNTEKLVRMYSQIAELELNRREYRGGRAVNYERASEYAKKLVGLYSKSDEEGKKLIKDAVKKIVGDLLQFRDSSRVKLAKEILTKLYEINKEALGELEIEIYKNKSKQHAQKGAEKEKFKIKKPDDLDNMIRANDIALPSFEAEQLIFAAREIAAKIPKERNDDKKRLIRLNVTMLVLRAAYILDDKTAWDKVYTSPKIDHAIRHEKLQEGLDDILNGKGE